ncbi:hypothetical protein BFV94_4313 [Alteromonas macleodii]|uniref:Uncharacterized protein n=1 Tax=Alteromonas macleodii TaxID=28108 RepID=A0AB36FSI0_ALTMA|nr:hypothetical protein BFV93_4701 [Alteromonas macleodii]OES25787.1 hypothetical protein BFV94_4313 [Alteromonas macleodii]OES25868.1 hypothetical protein BFV95_4256 [Alteromonas macleodii]OES38969.1 hypothetical protein BFV96_4463 [Alteromonas macleodii]
MPQAYSTHVPWHIDSAITRLVGTPMALSGRGVRMIIALHTGQHWYKKCSFTALPNRFFA